MGQMCSSVPQSLMTLKPEVTEIAARLSTSFFIETFIHAKEKVRLCYLSIAWIVWNRENNAIKQRKDESKSKVTERNNVVQVFFLAFLSDKKAVTINIVSLVGCRPSIQAAQRPRTFFGASAWPRGSADCHEHRLIRCDKINFYCALTASPGSAPRIHPIRGFRLTARTRWPMSIALCDNIKRHVLLFTANNGVLGRVGDEAVQRVCCSFRVVPRAYGRRYMVADASEYTIISLLCLWYIGFKLVYQTLSCGSQSEWVYSYFYWT